MAEVKSVKRNNLRKGDIVDINKLSLLEKREIISIDLVETEKGLKKLTDNFKENEGYTEKFLDEDGIVEDMFIGDGLLSTIEKDTLSEETINEIKNSINGDRAIEGYKLPIKFIIEGDLEEEEVEVFNESAGVKVKKIWKIPRKDIEPYAVATRKTTRRNLRINYSKIFERNINEFLEKYYIDQKSYASIADRIENDLNYVLNVYPEFAFTLISFRTRAIKEKENYTSDKFLIDVIKLISDVKLRSIIKAMVETTYTISLDEKSLKANKKIIEDLQLTDKSNKALLEIAIMTRLLIPVISQYNEDTIKFVNKEKRKDRFSGMALSIFEYITKFISYENDINLVTKIYKIVEPRVRGTNYSNRVIWNFLENHTLDDDTAIFKFVNNIIRTIIPKLNPNSSTISFLDVVIRRMLDCDFKVNYALAFKKINVMATNDEDSNEIDIISANKKFDNNEMLDIINGFTMSQILGNYSEEFNITDKQVEYIKENIPYISDFQYQLLLMFFNGKFKINDFNSDKISRMLLIIYNIAKKNNLYYLPKIILGKLDTNETPKKRTNNRIYTDVLESKNYQKIRDQYSVVSESYDRSAYLIKLSSIYNYSFIYYDPIEETSDYLECSDKKLLSDEIFRFKLIQ